MHTIHTLHSSFLTVNTFETPQETKVWAELAAGAGQNGQRFYFAHGLLCEVKRFAKP